MKTSFTNFIKKNVKFNAALTIFIIWFLWNEKFGSRILTPLVKNNSELNFWIYFISNTLLIFALLFFKTKLDFKIKWKKDIVIICVGIIVMLFLDNIVVYLNKFFQTPTETLNTNNIIIMKKNNPILTFVFTVFLGPLAEEIIFRVGMIRLFIKTGKFNAILLSSFIFGFAHIFTAVVILGKNWELLSLINYGGSGIVFGYTFVKYRRFSLIYLMHLCNNLITYIP